MRRRQFLTGLTTLASVTGLAGVGLSQSAQASTAHTTRSANSWSPLDPSARAGAFAGGSWATVPIPEARGAAQLQGVAAESADLAWAVGSQLRDEDEPAASLALRWDGLEWTETDTAHLGRTGGIRSVSAGGEGNTWAVTSSEDDGGRLLSWDGTSWQRTAFSGQAQPGSGLNAVLASDTGEAWAVGSHAGEPGLTHWDGNTWRWAEPLPSGSIPRLVGLDRAPDGSIWVYGQDSLARWDGAWTLIDFVALPRTGITGLAPVSNDDVWLVGWTYGVGGPPGKPSSVVLEHYDGQAWERVDKPFTPGALLALCSDERGVPKLTAGWDYREQTSAHYAYWNPDTASWISERGENAGEGSVVTPAGLASIPGTTAGYWSVGHLGGAPRVELRS